MLKTPNNPEDDDGLSTKPPLSFQDYVFNHTLATSNTTVDRIFSNSTGHLVQCPLYYNDSIVLYYELMSMTTFISWGRTVSYLRSFPMKRILKLLVAVKLM